MQIYRILTIELILNNKSSKNYLYSPNILDDILLIDKEGEFQG